MPVKPSTKILKGKSKEKNFKGRGNVNAKVTKNKLAHKENEITTRKRNIIETQSKDEDELLLENAVFGSNLNSISLPSIPLSSFGDDLNNHPYYDDNDGDNDFESLLLLNKTKSRKSLFLSFDEEEEKEKEESNDNNKMDIMIDNIQENSNIDDFSFFIDTNGDEEEIIKSDKKEEEEEEENENEEKEYIEKSILNQNIPAWEDDDDQEFSVNLASMQRLKKLRTDFSEKNINLNEFENRLRSQFQRIYPTPKWAELSKENDDDKNNENTTIGIDLSSILANSKGFIDTKRKQYNPEKLEVTRVKDANQLSYSDAVVQSAKFHPTAPILLTAGYDRTLRLFQIDGRLNPKIQSFRLKDMPIHQASFSANGTEIIMTGKRKYYYTFDLQSGSVERIYGVSGRDNNDIESYAKHLVSNDGQYLIFYGMNGNLIVQSRKTNQWICNLKMNGELKHASFSSDCKYLFSSGTDGEIYQWDIGQRKCVSRFFDEGCIKSSSLAVTGSGNNIMVAAGSNTGVVNLYDSNTFMNNSTPKPKKTIMNLTTSITTLEFSHDSQILTLASKEKRDSLKMLHVPSGKIFQNWPTQQTPLGYVNCVDFSSNNDWFTIGNDKGKALLYRLH